ncbi:2,3-diaminopropionate biosynthesis protein SbnA [Streptomyces sp. NBC_00986]|uniref:2,3-diaminopropionate biosynthesis protein SbnA n=1 Tax=Streptomyces sp. NBC_00986 TaxID=2903702 RepID=UPI00386A3D62|nr:2,3-diaminopropionate biosynthesis protein SbnA [Streptomyces sp. NBC_00986]
MIADYPFELSNGPAFVRLDGFQPAFETFVKLEGLNPAGSIKLTTAREMVESAEANGILHTAVRLIESTSGNLGIALAAVCAAKGIRVTLVTDPNTSPRSVRYMEALGAQVVTVTDRDHNGGFLQTRIDYITRRLVAEPELVWLNQYASPANPGAHRKITATQIVEEFGIPDWLFIGVGTSGTLMGCLEHFRSIGAPTRIVGVDTTGSVTFGGPAGPRWIPGLGTSRCPEIFHDDGFDKCVVEEPETIRVCRQVARRYGLLLGGSSGTTLAAVEASGSRIAPGSRVLAISPDLGDRYLETVYDDDWVLARFGPNVLERVGTGQNLGRGLPRQLTPGGFCSVSS